MDQQLQKRRPISDAQWLAARALSEGAPPTRSRIAAMLGCDDSAVYARAALEGWLRPDFRSRQVQAAHRDFMDLVLARSPGTDGHGSGSAEAVMDAAGDAAWADEHFSVGGPSARASDGGSGRGAAEAAAADGSEEDPFAVLARGNRVMAGRLAALIARAERGARLDKAEIDNLFAMARMMERWETLAKERAKEEETESDEDLAETLRTIDRRIVELAREEAARLVAEGYRPGEG